MDIVRKVLGLESCLHELGGLKIEFSFKLCLLNEGIIVKCGESEHDQAALHLKGLMVCESGNPNLKSGTTNWGSHKIINCLHIQLQINN